MSGINRTSIEGYEEFCKSIEGIQKQKQQIYVLFSGSKDTSGHSWCPDCVKAMPVVENALKAASDLHFVYVEVGDRAYWKNQNCPFRTDKRLQLKSVPTLMKWGHVEKLENDECSNPDLVSMLFENED
ncbi:hypothetical protein L9F63_012804 [Diploptera punctata]|uniref:Thioredoxin domain-containing protein 17 n=1 Tax=Diploptera punctata TaxID=6984 RepID=A0AAD8ABH2_DIPPU|nr:hypothetical protein L9F63_012804 [Diploptera punctata]